MSDSTFFAPGEYIRDIMIDDYAAKLNLEVEEYEDLLIGKYPIDKDLADKIEEVTKVSAETWINLQLRYDMRNN